MKVINRELQNWAHIITDEIAADEGKGEYFWPKSKSHEIFEQAYMKFINRNLNYFHLENMIRQTTEGNEFNPAFAKTLEFCRFVRTLSPEHAKSPFGRMCIWNLPAGKKLLPHRDDYMYHRFVTRNIFVISDNTPGSIKINIENQLAPVEQGVLWQFNPDVELHEFENNDDKPFFFMGFDFWNLRLLQALTSLLGPETDKMKAERYSGFGGPGTKCKYMSKH